MSDVKVTLTLRGPIAERLRAMCHKRGTTASNLIDRWILAHDENGDPVKPAVTGRSKLDGMLDDMMGRRGR